ncbi:hypothetical protein LCGC14_2664460, partial [marine sediment metagenome]
RSLARSQGVVERSAQREATSDMFQMQSQIARMNEGRNTQEALQMMMMMQGLPGTGQPQADYQMPPTCDVFRDYGIM